MSKSHSSSDNEPALTFELSLARLQQIVSDLESGLHGLEESLRQFEEAIGLLRACYRTLEHAEQHIEALTGYDSTGQPVCESIPTAEFPEATEVLRRKPSAKKHGRTMFTEPE